MKKLIVTIICSLFLLNGFSKINKETIDSIRTKYQQKYPEINFKKFILVSVREQKLYCITRNRSKKEFQISTSVFGIGNKMGTNRTPLGLHQIEEKHGENTPYGGIIKDRIYTGAIVRIITEKIDIPNDYITTRILWLKGLEIGLNSGEGIDSYERYIYIHGTVEEGLIGTPASYGCVRMRNNDILWLFDKVKLCLPVIIVE